MKSLGPDFRYGSIAPISLCLAAGPLTPQQRTCCLAIDPVVLSMIQAPKGEHRIMRYELSDCEWSVIKPMLPNKPRGIPRVDDRRVLNGIFWALRSGAPWRDLPEVYGPPYD